MATKGLDLCERYFLEEGRSIFRRHFGTLYDRMAFGLVGDGSECYGYDDDLSRDHDWGPGFCVWLNQDDFAESGLQVQQVYDGLPKNFLGYPQRSISQWGSGRIGVLEISAFYRSFIGVFQPPAALEEWLALPENALAAATNGKVFQDTAGEFSRIRQSLLRYYPEDIRLKKIAARCMSIGREGQYNFPRSIKRSEYYAARFAETKFCADVLSMVFLLNKAYAPFYKWIHRAVKELPVMGTYFHQAVVDLIQEGDAAIKIHQMETMVQTLISELKQQGLSRHSSDYLPDHGAVVQQKIQNDVLRERNVWIG